MRPFFVNFVPEGSFCHFRIWPPNFLLQFQGAILRPRIGSKFFNGCSTERPPETWFVEFIVSESVTKLPKSERNYHTNQNGSNFETWMQHTVCHKVTLSLKVRYLSIHQYKPKQILYPAWNQIFSFKQVQLISAYGTINPQMSLYLWRELW